MDTYQQEAFKSPGPVLRVLMNLADRAWGSRVGSRGIAQTKDNLRRFNHVAADESFVGPDAVGNIDPFGFFRAVVSTDRYIYFVPVLTRRGNKADVNKVALRHDLEVRAPNDWTVLLSPKDAPDDIDITVIYPRHGAAEVAAEIAELKLPAPT